MRRITLILLAALLALLLPACAGRKPSTPRTGTNASGVRPDPLPGEPGGSPPAPVVETAPDPASEFAYPLNVKYGSAKSWVGELGTYSTQAQGERWGRNKKPYSLIMITDHVTGETIPLCNKAACEHKDDACNAFLPGPGYYDTEWSYHSATEVGLFMDGGRLYVLNGTELLRMNPDGTGRTPLLELPDIYENMAEQWLYKGKLYLNAGVPYLEEESPGRYNNVHHWAMMEIDYHKKTYRELFRIDYNKSMRYYMGLWDDQFYIYERNNFIGIQGTSQALWEKTLNERTALVYTMGLDGTRTVLLEDKTHGYDEDYLIEPYILCYHSRREGEIVRWNMKTGDKEVLLDGLTGFYRIHGLRDGRLIIERNNYDSDIRADPPRENEWFWYDEPARALREISLTTEILMADNDPSYSFAEMLYAAGGYYYYLAVEDRSAWEIAEDSTITNEMDEEGNPLPLVTRYRLGRIRAQDYWNNNTGAVELLDWFDESEWYEVIQRYSQLKQQNGEFQGYSVGMG